MNLWDWKNIRSMKMIHFGFSYMGLIFLLMLFIPNIIWTKHKPKDYEQYVVNENKVFLNPWNSLSPIYGVYPINTGCNTVSFLVSFFTQWVKIKTYDFLFFPMFFARHIVKYKYYYTLLIVYYKYAMYNYSFLIKFSHHDKIHMIFSVSL